jgi:hypothetical protein
MRVRGWVVASAIGAASCGLVAGMPGVAWAKTTSNSGVTTVVPPSKPPTTSGLPFTPSPPPKSVTLPFSSSSSLPFTGADVVELGAVAVLALGGGGAILAWTRRRTS